MDTLNNTITGLPIHEAKKVLIMLHGRGGTAASILQLTNLLQLESFHIIAPQATNKTWYPYSFLSPKPQNEPFLSSAIANIHKIIDDLIDMGFSSTQIYLLGFSQGACLALESTAQKAQHYGGVIAFTGGLIGEKIELSSYSGDFKHTPIFIGSGNPDAHVPVERVYESEEILRQMGANVTTQIYPGIPHTIIEEELEWVNKNIFEKKD
jgi:phospholipase/carboxylesterase